MNEQFQQAVVASRAGQIKEAQFLLAQSLQKEPNNADAWLLLSQLVESKEKQQMYLAKAVEIDPDHALAKEYQAALAEETAAIAPAVADESDDMAELEAILDADVDEPLPDLEDTDMDDWLAAAVAADSVDDDADAFDALESVDIADLIEKSDEKAAVDTATAPIAQKKEKKEIAVEKKDKTAVIDPKAAERQKKVAQLNYMIYGLIVIAILVVLYMAYLLIA